MPTRPSRPPATARRCGWSAASVMMSSVPDCASDMAASGVDLAHVRTVAQGSGMSVAIQEGSGDYAAIVVSGANRQLDAEQIEASGAAIEGSRVLLLQHEIAEAANAAAARLARAAGATVVLNAAPARPLGGLAGLVDVLVVNGVEAEMLGAGPVGDLDSALAAARSLLSLAPAVVVTAGAAGVAAAAEDGHGPHRSPPGRPGRDTWCRGCLRRCPRRTPRARGLAGGGAALRQCRRSPACEHAPVRAGGTRSGRGRGAAERSPGGGPSRRLSATLSCAPAEQSGCAAPRPRRRPCHRRRRPRRPAKARAAGP